jgi:hypothetical protein
VGKAEEDTAMDKVEDTGKGKDGGDDEVSQSLHQER